MTQPVGIGGRPLMPAPGVPVPERRIARWRRHGRRLVWPALVLIAVCAVAGYFWDNLPAPVRGWGRDWMLFAVAGLLVLVLVLLPFLSWWAHRYTLTTERIIEQRGLFRRTHRELSHARGYTVTARRGIVQRMWGAGTLVLADGLGEPLRLRDIPNVSLVQEALVDQVEVGQILAHRDAGVLPQDPPAPTA